MRLNAKNKIIVGVIALILTLTIGYAVLTQSINIKGTASAKGEFGLIFENSSESPTCVGFSGECTNSSLYSITGDKNDTLNITVDKLNYPTAYVTIPVIIKNIGTVDAELKNMNIDVDKNREDISITYTGISNNEVLKAKEQREMLVKVEWTDTSIVETAVVTFQMSLSYAQKAIVASSSSSGGSTGGDSGDGTGEDKSWTYKVNQDGLITAYNYAFGTDVVVPAEVDGIPVKTIDKKSFLQTINGSLYFSNDQKYYILISEKGTKYTTVRTKLINYFMSMCSSDDTECQENMKKNLYVCSDENTCYSVSEEESGNATKSALPSDAQLFSVMSVNTDPNVSVSDSISQPKVNVTSLDLSKATNLTTIEEESFKDIDLTNINFGDNSNLETIGNSAFEYNKISGEIVIPKSVTTIGDYAFRGNQISSLTFTENNNLSLLGTQAFNGNQISNLVFGENSSLSAIGNGAFGSNQISDLTISSGITSIENEAFQNNQISSVFIPNSLIKIGDNVFFGNQINSLTFAENSNLSVIGASAFNNNQISSLTLPSSLVSIGNRAFSDNQISNLAFAKNSSLTTIGEYTFDNNQISSLTLSEGVVQIKDYAFQNNQISILTIPKSVTTIGNNAFYSNQISNLEIPKTVTELGASAFAGNPIATLKIGRCNVNACSNNSFGSQVTNLTIESGEIGESAFYSKSMSDTKVKNLVLGEGVTEIGSSAFENNNSLGSITIPSSIRTIGYHAFSACYLDTIIIKMTEEDFKANVTADSGWYDYSNPAITYEP